MELTNFENTHTHRSDAANFNDYLYTQVYAANNTITTINGTKIYLPAGVILDIVVETIECNPDVYLLGHEIYCLYHCQTHDIKTHLCPEDEITGTFLAIDGTDECIEDSVYLLTENGNKIRI